MAMLQLHLTLRAVGHLPLPPTPTFPSCGVSVLVLLLPALLPMLLVAAGGWTGWYQSLHSPG